MSSGIDQRLKTFTTAELSDALDELGVLGVLTGIVPQREGQGRIAGRAMPVHLAPKSKDPTAYRFGGGVGKPLEQVLQTMANGDVVIMDLQGTHQASAWGGLASRLAQQRGVRGTIMWGACRDVEEIREIGYPVWAVGTCPRRSRNEFTFGSINEPISIQGITIRRNDWIVADATGITCIAQDAVEQVIATAERIRAQEQQLTQMVESGNVTSWDQL